MRCQRARCVAAPASIEVVRGAFFQVLPSFLARFPTERRLSSTVCVDLPCTTTFKLLTQFQPHLMEGRGAAEGDADLWDLWGCVLLFPVWSLGHRSSCSSTVTARTKLSSCARKAPTLHPGIPQIHLWLLRRDRPCISWDCGDAWRVPVSTGVPHRARRMPNWLTWWRKIGLNPSSYCCLPKHGSALQPV